MLLLLENNKIMLCYDSDNCLYENNTDSCEGYVLFNEEGTFEDSGELDFNSNNIKTESALYDEIIEFATDQKLNYKIIANTSDCYYDNFNELLEEEFDNDSLIEIIKSISNEKLKEKIQKLIK